MRNLLVPVLLVAALLAGCVANDATPDVKSQSFDYDALEAQIGAPIDGDGWTETAADHVNLERVALVGGPEGRAAQPAEGFVESAVRDGYAYICRTGPEQGLVIFDIHDVEHPVYTGYVKLHAGFEADVEVSQDSQFAFWETQRVHLSVPPVPPSTDPLANLPNGIHVVDVSDKSAPKWVSYVPVQPDGPHSITYANIGGEDYVFASIYAYAYNHDPFLAVPGEQRLAIYHLDRTASPAPALELVSEFIDPAVATESGRTDGEPFPHDVTVQVHPVTNQTLAYIAYWDLGVVILDVSDPAHPTKVGQTTDFGPAGYADIHMARSFPTLIDGRHITVAEPEISGQPDSGYLTFIDTTDPTHPTYVSSWKIPGDSPSGATGGPHYFDVDANGRVALSHYAGGFWVIDAHDATNLVHPRTVAYAQVAPATAAGPALPGPLAGLGGGSAFDAWWVDPTHIIGSETGSGLAVFRYTGPNEPVQS